MRILHIIQRYWPIRGGAEIHLDAFSTRLAADGHTVTVATSDAKDFELFWHPGAGRFDASEAWHDGVRILRFPVGHVPVAQLAYPAIRRLLWLLSAIKPVPVPILSRLARWTPWMPDLWRWLRETDESFDLVAAMTITFEPLLEAGLRFARRRGVPFVLYPLTHLGAGPEPGIDALSRFYTMRHQVDLVRRSDAVVAQTPAERDFYVARGVDPTKIHIVGPGFEPDEVIGGDGSRFRARHGLEGPIVFMLTKMSYDKGVPHTIEAMAQLWATGSQAHLVLAGDVLDTFGAFYDRLPDQTRARITLLGTVSDEEKRDLLAAGDILVMPSRTDSFGIVYLEAWAYGTPVIGARTWGVMDVIDDGVDGLLVPFADPPALAEAIGYLLDNADQAQRMGERGKAKALTQHTWDHKYPGIRDLYLRLVAAQT
ncbi:MAG: glycosyltransferase family 4 protein [Anaerolineae bacterium]|nr:glycosyltransferase family 4 protein [Anaerolineae bacterium]